MRGGRGGGGDAGDAGGGVGFQGSRLRLQVYGKGQKGLRGPWFSIWGSGRGGGTAAWTR